MVFFVVSHQSLTGVGANISRLLQIATLLFLVRLAIVGNINLRISGFTKRYTSFVLYFSLAVMSGVIGLLMGVYSLGPVSDGVNIAFPAVLINSPYFRPIFEYVVLAYYIIYFAVLPSIILKKEEDVKYFFKVFFLMFNISLFVGLIGILLYWQYGINIVGRHLYEWYTTGARSVGFRFHGFFGEPRDAFVVLGLGAAFYYLKSIIFNKPQSKCYYALLLICLYFTRSFSGMVGVAIFIMIYLVINCLELNLKLVIKTFILVSVLSVSFYFAIVNSFRLQLYVYGLTVGLKGMFFENITPRSFEGQMNNIYPIRWIFDNLSQFNPIPLLLGGGVGSVSIVNNFYGAIGSVNNPNAGIVRVIAETGIIGCSLYITAFYIPVKRMTMQLSYRIRNNIIMSMVLVLSLSLGQRSAANFIFIGVLFAAFNTLTEANLKKHEDSLRQ
jgi:hypothetical protein